MISSSGYGTTLVLWGIICPFPCLCYLLHDFVMSYTAICVPPVGYPSVCLHISKFSQKSFLILEAFPPGINWGTFWTVLQKYFSDLIFVVLGMTL